MRVINDMRLIIGIFLWSLITGALSIRAINRFMGGKINQWSFEYQVFGFGGMLACVFGLIYSISGFLAWLINRF